MEVPSDDENGNGVTVTSTIVTGTSQSSPVPFLLDELRKSRAAQLDDIWNLLPGEVVTNITASTFAHERLFPGLTESGILSVSWAPRKDPRLLEESTTASAAPTAVYRLREAMAGTKGQPHLMGKLEMMVKAAPKAKKRREKAVAEGKPPPKPNNNNMIFGGPPGMGKTSSVRKMGPVLHELGVLESPNLVVVDKETGLPKPPKKNHPTVAECVSYMFQEAEGGILFIDEIHQRTQKEFIQPLLTALQTYEGRVMVIIAGYTDGPPGTPTVTKWLKESDQGMSRRFPPQGRVEFAKLDVPTLFQIAISKLEVEGFSLADSAASDALCACMHVVHDTDPPIGGSGAFDYANAMIERHDANESYDEDDTRITTAEIFAVCPKARGSRAAKTRASGHTAPGPSEVVAGDTGPSETGGGMQADHSSSAVVAVDDSEEDQPLALRSKQPAPSGSTSSSRKRKERESSSDVAGGASDAVPSNPLLETALRALYPTPESAIGTFRLDIFKALNESDDMDVRKGWKSLGNEEAREQVLQPQKSNKAANEMMHAAMLAVHGLEFESHKAEGKGEQGGWRVKDPASQ